MGKTSRTMIKRLAIFGLLALVVLVLGWSGWQMQQARLAFDASRLKQIPFESAGWKSRREISRGHTLRSAMIDDLLTRQKFICRTQKQVETLLGPPDRTQLDNLYEDDKAKWDFGYFLGADRGFGIDIEVLVFRLDAAGRVLEYRVALY